jgi:hypothetical protein
MASLSATVVVGSAWFAAAQDSRPLGRVSFYTTAVRLTPTGGEAATLTEFITTLSYRAPAARDTGLEYAVELRLAGYGNEGRKSRVSIYDGWIGTRVTNALGVRAGQMWINDLGALGSVAGAAVEYRKKAPITANRLRVRVAGFVGVEPENLEFGYVDHVKKYGTYLALDGEGARRHVVGYVLVKNSGLTERSVVSITNFVPLKQRFFLYQAAEIDAQGPGGAGPGGLTYFLTNARVSPTPRLDVQGTFHRGRSIDARTIALDQLNGRPVRPEALDGLLFESAGGRVTAEVFKGVRAYAGYTRDRSNFDSQSIRRTTFGAHAANVANSGLDLSVSDSRIRRFGSTYDAWYVSAGHMLGTKVYVTGEFSTALSVFRTTGQNGITIESRPRTKLFGASAVVNLSRALSLQITGERMFDQTVDETRVLAGISHRF